MNHLKHKLLLALAVFVTFISLLSPAVLAADEETSEACPEGVAMTVENNNSPDSDVVCCPEGSTDGTSCIMGKYITPAVQLMSVLVGLAVTAAIIIGAIEYASSAGEPTKAAAGQKRIRNAIITLVLYIFLVAGLNFIVPGGFF